MREEDQIQAAIVAWIAVAAPDVLAYACPNAAKRIKGGRASNAVPGLRKGVFDLALVLPDGRAAFVEVKTTKGVLSADQKEFSARLSVLGVPQAVCRSIDDVRRAFAAWNVKTREHGARPAVLFGERAEAPS